MYVIGLARLVLRTPCRPKAGKYVDVRLRTLRPERLLPEDWGDYKSIAAGEATLRGSRRACGVPGRRALNSVLRAFDCPENTTYVVHVKGKPI